MVNINEVIKKLSLHGISVFNLDTLDQLFIAEKESYIGTFSRSGLVKLLEKMEGK